MNWLTFILAVLEEMAPLLQQFSELLEKLEHVLIRLMVTTSALVAAVVFFVHYVASKVQF